MKLLSLRVIQTKLRKLGLIDSENKPVLYSTFKNMATVHKYTNRSYNMKIVFVGVPKDNLFGFYAAFKNDTDVNVMREAYANLCKIAKGDLEPHKSGDVRWGNCGIPLAYGDIRVV